MSDAPGNGHGHSVGGVDARDEAGDIDDLDDLAGHPSHAAAEPQADGFAIAALACALVSFVAPVVPAVAALYLAAASDLRIEAMPDRASGTAMNQASRTLAWLSMALHVSLMLLVLTGIAGKVFTGD